MKEVEYEMPGEQCVLLIPELDSPNEFEAPRKTNICIIKYLTKDLDASLRNKGCIVPDALIHDKSKYVIIDGTEMLFTNFINIVAIID